MDTTVVHQARPVGRVVFEIRTPHRVIATVRNRDVAFEALARLVAAGLTCAYVAHRMERFA